MTNKTQLKENVECEGVGLHSGKPARITFSPTSKKGIYFKKNSVLIPAAILSIVDTTRGVTLGVGDETVQTVEHLLSAMRWLGIADAEITVLGEEIPALDGSAKKWIEMLSSHLLKTKERFSEQKIERIKIEEGGSFIEALPSERLFIRYTIDFPGTPVGRQTWEGEVTPEVYQKEISPARTFGFIDEVEDLKKQGLALGGNLENAVVIGGGGFLAPLRFPDEMVRHKVLDLLGDLALLPWIPLGKLEVYKGSHRLHTALAKALQCQTKVR